MRIALFTEVFLPKIDGVVTRLLRTLDELDRMGHEVLIFAPGTPPASYRGFTVQRVRSVAFKPWYPELQVGLPTAAIAQAMEEFHPHVVHAVNPVWLAAYGTLSARRRDLPLLASFHTDVPAYATALGLDWITHTTSRWIKWIHNRSQVNLCTSEQMVSRARSVGILNVSLWPKAVDTQGYSPQNFSASMRARLSDDHPEDPLMIYVGRLSKEKGLHNLRAALAHMPSTTRLAIVGSGPHADELKREFAGTRTVFTGYLGGADLAAAYASADVFVFPSTTETLGLVALESMASGVPVVGARAGGIPFAVKEGIGGLLYEPDDPSELAAKATRLLSNPQERARFALSARAEAEKHDWSSSTQALVNFYEQAIDSYWSDHRSPGWRMQMLGRSMPRA